EEVEVLALLPELRDELVDEPRLADAGLAVDEGHLTLAPRSALVERAEERDLRVAAEERGVARDADAARRARRLDPDLRGTPPPRPRQGRPRAARPTGSAPRGPSPGASAPAPRRTARAAGRTRPRAVPSR